MHFSDQFPQISKQESTKLTYRREGERLAKRLAKQANSNDASVIAAHFLATGSKYAQRTFRLYKAYLIEFMEASNVAPSVVKEVRDASSRHCAKRGGEGTSGKKLKSLSTEDSTKLLNTMREVKSKTAIVAADYFEAGLLIGPRPIEWIDQCNPGHPAHLATH